jgi:uncharacterized protein
MKPRIIYIHGNGAMSWKFAFSTWLKTELEKSGFETVFETFPDSIIARSEYWLANLKDYINAGEKDVLVGWSSGAVAAMRYAENNKILGSVLISPSYTDLGDELEKQSGYFDKPWEWEKIKNNQKKIALFYGDNDLYIPQEQFKFIADKLKLQIFRIPDGKHFIEFSMFPQVLEYIKKNYL